MDPFSLLNLFNLGKSFIQPQKKATPAPTTQKKTTPPPSKTTAPAPKQTTSAPSGESKDYGGWYYNPATGKTQRWFDGVWTDGAEPNQQAQSSQQAQQQFDPVSQAIKIATDKFSSAMDEYKRKSKEFDETNPFAYDKVLEEEKTKVSQRLDPYYTQTLDDYLTGINRTRQRSIQDEQTILGELTANTDFYQGEAKKSLDNAIESSREGFADSGLYGSGKQLRTEGQLTEKSQSNLTNYLTNAQNKQSQIQLAGKRLREEDLPLEERLKRRDLTQEKSYNVESQALGEVQRRQKQREFERSQYTGAPPTINPLQFDTASYNYLG